MSKDLNLSISEFNTSINEFRHKMFLNCLYYGKISRRVLDKLSNFIQSKLIVNIDSTIIINDLRHKNLNGSYIYHSKNSLKTEINYLTQNYYQVKLLVKLGGI